MPSFKHSTDRHFATLVIMCLVGLSLGCSHQAEIRNLSQYDSNVPVKLARPVKIGVTSTAEQPECRRLLRGIGKGLSERGATVSHYAPFGAIDYTADINIQSHHGGSIANFFITFPGFLVWAPAWHGFVYHTDYDVAVELRQGGPDGQVLDSLQVPIELDIRHSEMDRTWVEISWLEWGVIAFVGGIYNTTYDNDVTPIVAEMIEYPVGHYIADAVSRRVNEHLNGGRTSSVLPQPELTLSKPASAP